MPKRDFFFHGLYNKFEVPMRAIEDGETVIPVIGNELLVMKDSGENIYRYITRFFLEDISGDFAIGKIDNRNYIDGLLKDPEVSDEYLFNYLFYVLIKEGYPEKNINHKVRELFNYIEEQHLLDEEPFEKLARIKHFKYYINTTISRVLERKIESERDVFKYGYKKAFFGYDNLQLGYRDMPVNEAGHTKPIIYNILGTHEHRGFVYTESAFLEFQFKFHEKLQGKGLVNFRSVVQEANTNLLFLGCNFPNWMFRTFIRLFAAEDLRKAKGSNFSIADQLVKADENRTFFMNNHRIYYFDLQVVDFVGQLYNDIKDKHPQQIVKNRTDGLVFISYASENRAMAVKLYYWLEENGISAWLDDKDIQIDNFNEKIKAGMDDCSLVMPILTRESLGGAPDRHYRREWEYAINQKKKLIPVFIGMDRKEHLGMPAEFSKRVPCIQAETIEELGMPEEQLQKIRDLQDEIFGRDDF